MAGVWLPIQVWAAQTEVEIDMPEGYSKAVFYVTWENYEQPGTIVLTSPSGKVYSKKKTPDQVYEANGEAIIHVGKGEEGTDIYGLDESSDKIYIDGHDYTGMKPGDVITSDQSEQTVTAIGSRHSFKAPIASSSISRCPLVDIITVSTTTCSA